MRPSVGRIVHFALSEKEVCAAVVVGGPWDEEQWLVNLQLLPDSDLEGIYNQAVAARDRWRTSVAYDEESRKPGTWHWPDRVS